MKPMMIKPEGLPYPIVNQGWWPEHPAKDCEARFWASVESSKDRFAPRGEAWVQGIYVWTCYMRIAGNGLMEHRHGKFIDPEQVRGLVFAGHADDIFRGMKFVAQEVSIEKMPKGNKVGPADSSWSERLPPDGEKPSR